MPDSLFAPYLVIGPDRRTRFRRMSDDEKRDMFRVLAEAATLENCQRWPGGLTPHGYAHIRYDGRTQLAHRVALELRLGHPLPPGFDAAHWLADFDSDSCHRSCVNWVHLEAMPHAANVLASGGLTAQHARKVCCPAGHPYDASRTHPDGSRTRVCSICRNLFNRARYRRREQQEDRWLGLAERPARRPKAIN